MASTRRWERPECVSATEPQLPRDPRIPPAFPEDPAPSRRAASEGAGRSEIPRGGCRPGTHGRRRERVSEIEHNAALLEEPARSHRAVSDGVGRSGRMSLVFVHVVSDEERELNQVFAGGSPRRLLGRGACPVRLGDGSQSGPPTPDTRWPRPSARASK